MLDNKRDPELSGTYRFRWHHAPPKGECGPAYKLVDPDFDADKSMAASASGGNTTKKKKSKKKKSSKHPSGSKSLSSDTYSDLDLAVKNEPHSEQYLAILAQREESRKAREAERAKGLEALPPITDDESAAMRRKFLEDQKRKEYALKERELDEDNTEKLRKYKSTLTKRQEHVTNRIVGSAQNVEEVVDANVVDVTRKTTAAVEEKSEQKRTTNTARTPCTCSRTCENMQRSPKPKEKSTASIKNRRAQQQLASDIELMERKFEEQDDRQQKGVAS